MGIVKRIGTYLCISIITLLLSIISVKAISIEKYYDVNYQEPVEILVYETDKQLDIYEKQANLTLQGTTRNGKYGLYLYGIPNISGGKIRFKGNTKSSNDYTVDLDYDINVTISRQKINVTKTYNATAGVSIGNVLVYGANGSDTFKDVSITRNGITLKTANFNGKYGLYLVGTPEGAGKVTFTGQTYNENNITSSNTYDVVYNITINVANKERQDINVTKSYNGTVGKSIGDILVYQTNGDHGNINSTKNGLTLKTDTDGLRLSGTPTQGGVITFSGYFTEGDSYKINYNITVTVPNPNKQQVKVERLYNAVVGKEIGKVLVYENTNKLPDLEKTEKGVTLKTETENNKTKIYLSGKPTEDGQVIFSGTLDEGNRDIVYYIVVTIAKKGTTNNTGTTTSNTGNNTTSNTTNNTTNNTTTEQTNNDDNKAVEPISEVINNDTKKEETKNNNTTNNETKEEKKEDNKTKDLIIPVAIGVGVLIGLLLIIKAVTKKKKAL